MRRAAIISAFALLALAPAATAASRRVSFSNLNVPARISGALIVRFHGDAATGCRARGLCAYSGTVIWTPENPDEFSVAVLQTPTRTDYSAYLTIGEGGDVSNGGGTTDADTEDARGAGAACADAAYTGSFLRLGIAHKRAQIKLARAAPDLFQTRCAGPLANDLAAALPSATLPLAALMRGEMRISLTGEHGFASNGFSGTVSSTVAISLGKPGRLHDTEVPAASAPERSVTLVYRAMLAGNLTAAVRGEADEGLCGPLGACGIKGTELVQPSPVGQADFTAIAGAKHSYAQLLRALEAGRGTRGVEVYGFLSWPAGGTVTTKLKTSGGTCTDHTGLAPAQAQAGIGERNISVQYSIGGYANTELRTRCPGPFDPREDVALGHAPMSIIGRQSATIPMVGTSGFRDDGYIARISSSLRIVLSHPRIKHGRQSELTTVAN